MAVPDTLFRREVTEFQQRDREWGCVVLLQPVSTQILTWSIVGAMALIVAFLSLAQYARKENVVGYLTLSNGRSRIFVPQQGTIKKVHVTEGEVVREGQALLTVETSQISSDGQDVNASMIETLTNQQTLLAHQIAAEQRRMFSERARLLTQIKGLETEVTHLQKMAQLQQDRIEIFRRFVSAAQSLIAKGAVSEIEFRRRQQELLEQEQALNSFNQQIAARDNQLAETRFNLEQMPTLMAQKIQLMQNELSEVKQRITQADSRRAYIVRAPAAGRAATLQATVGQVADPRRMQLEIVPTHSILQAELFIPTRAVGFVQVGQDVRLLYEAFPYQKFGTYRARIVQLSKTVLTAADVAGPVQLQEPSYKAVAILDQSDIRADGKAIPLQPDMLLKADIILEKRSVISWLFNPVLGARNIVDTEYLENSVSEWVETIWNMPGAMKSWLIKTGLVRGDARALDTKDLEKI